MVKKNTEYGYSRFVDEVHERGHGKFFKLLFSFTFWVGMTGVVFSCYQMFVEGSPPSRQFDTLIPSLGIIGLRYNLL